MAVYHLHGETGISTFAKRVSKNACWWVPFGLPIYSKKQNQKKKTIKQFTDEKLARVEAHHNSKIGEESQMVSTFLSRIFR